MKQPPVGLTTKVRVTNVVDGDTIDVEIVKNIRIRLRDCWWPETRTRDLEEKEMYGGPIDEPVFKTWLVQKVGGDTWVYMNGIFGDYENRDKAKEYSSPKKDEEVDKNRIIESLRLQELIAIFSKDKKI